MGAWAMCAPFVYAMRSEGRWKGRGLSSADPVLALCHDTDKKRANSALFILSSSSSRFLLFSLSQQIAVPQKPHFKPSLSVCIQGTEDLGELECFSSPLSVSRKVFSV